MNRIAILAALLAVTLTAGVVAAQEGAVELLTDATWTFSTDGGKTFSADVPKTKQKMVARATFTVKNPSSLAGLWLIADKGAAYRYTSTLNGKPATGPRKEMLYRAIPLDTSILAKGKNELRITGPAHGGKMTARLIGYPPALVGIHTGPTLGAVGKDYFTLVCRTNVPATVTIKATVKPAGKKVTATSKRGFYHRMKIRIPEGGRELTYSATAAAGKASKTEGPYTFKLPDFTGKEPMTIVAAGDSRTHAARWAAVAKAIEKVQPHLVAFSGDMVGDGRWYNGWDNEFFHPGKGLLQTAPFYAIWGNHDGPQTAFAEFFYTPSNDGRALNWTQRIADVLLIGIQGGEKWQTGSENYVWLEGVLKKSDAKFIFLFSHYPGYSSGKHGKYGEAPMIVARKHIHPLLAKYKATAMIAGHDHNYERSEPPADKGVTAITTGGAGAPLRPKSGAAARNNPWSKVFVATLHYCLLTVDGDTCEMNVYDLRGKVLDQRTFKARKTK